MILVKSNYAVWPSQIFDIPSEEIDKEHERAFVLACMQVQRQEEEKALKKAEAKAKSKRRR